MDIPLYPHLLSPPDLRFGTLRSRTLMRSMHTGLEQAPEGYERQAQFLARRARGRTGLIVTGDVRHPARHLGRNGAVMSEAVTSPRASDRRDCGANTAGCGTGA